jgi:predicted dehydrogenase
LAAFTCGFGAAGVGRYQVVGTEGDLQVDPAFTYDGALRHHLTIGEKTRTQRFAPRDQFAPQLLHFSRCILKNQDPEPSGEEGLADVRIIEALYKSAETGSRVELPPFFRKERPTSEQETYRPKAKEPELVNVASPHD